MTLTLALCAAAFTLFVLLPHGLLIVRAHQEPLMTFEFLVDYAADKDHMGTVSGTAHVAVAADSFLDARLTAEQMVAALGVEPVAVAVA